MYVTLDQLKAKLPLAHLTDACDDDRDGVADTEIVNGICQAASNAVDSYLEGRYETPLAAENFSSGQLPAIVGRAALLFAIETIFQRRGVELTKELGADLASARATMERIQSGDQSLLAGFKQAGIKGAAITSPMATEASTL